jgi:carboxyl-terminal processing protease
MLMKISYAVVTVALGTLLAGDVAVAAHAGLPGRPAPLPPCAAATWPVGAVTPTTVEVVGQAYRCVRSNDVDGPVLDDRRLLAGAFGAVTRSWCGVA